MKIKDKVVKFFSEYYKIMIPIVLLMVLFVAFYTYYKVIILDNYRKDVDGSFYQWFSSKKYSYVGTVTTNRHNVIVDFKTHDYNIKFDSTPIYYQNKDSVIFSKDMSVVMPTLNCSEYLSRGYSYLKYSKDNYYLTTLKYYNSKLGHYFLYDGGDLYFFLDEVKLKVNNEEISLSPMSYVVANNIAKNISYYDKKSDTFKKIDVSNSNSLVYNDYYKINVSLDQINYYDSTVILTNDFSTLSDIYKKGN